MSTVTETAGAPARARQTGQGLRLADDKTFFRLQARRHTQRVRALKWALPLASFGAIGIYAASILATIGWKSSLPVVAMQKIAADNLAMENPHYEGFTSDGGKYWVKAERARQDLPSLTVIKLEAISGELTDAEKSVTKFSAARGVFDSKADLLDLFDSIRITGDDGLNAELTRATIKTKEGLITSDQPVKIALKSGVINADRLTARQKAKEYVFVDNVRAILKPSASQPAGQPTPNARAAAPAFGASGEPVTISANRLDIAEVRQSAVFTGSVIAQQGGGQLKAPELDVTFDGGAKPGAGEAKVTRIVAKNSVELRQASGEVINGDGADFDAVKQIAVIDGNVVVTQSPDRRATADRAELDQKANSVLLTGAVTLTQGANVMRGGRLNFDRTTNRMQLSAPGGSGRTYARFQQSDAKPRPTAAKSEPGDGQRGIPFSATFKTSPDAPVSVEAATLDVDDGARQAIFRGKVRAVQGDFVMQSNDLTATYTGAAGLSGANQSSGEKGSAQLSKLRARGAVQITSADGQKATGDWADFDTRANSATLGGDVILTQGKNVVRGTKLMIDMTTGQTVINTEPGASGPQITSSGADGAGPITKSQRPSAVFYPSEMKGQQSGKAASDANAGGWQARNQP